jgi:hypothetical protein
MKPVDQTIFVNDPEGRTGNCLQAALASVLMLPLEEVPHFADLPDDIWFSEMCNWLTERGYQLNDMDSEEMNYCSSYMLAIGMSERGVSHAANYDRNGLAHDPHPSKAGLLNISWVASINKANK